MRYNLTDRVKDFMQGLYEALTDLARYLYKIFCNKVRDWVDFIQKM